MGFSCQHPLYLREGRLFYDIREKPGTWAKDRRFGNLTTGEVTELDKILRKSFRIRHLQRTQPFSNATRGYSQLFTYTDAERTRLREAAGLCNGSYLSA